MTLDLLIPFAILLVLVVYLIYTRQSFEKNIVETYEKKFEEWKENSDEKTSEKQVCRELVALVYKEGYNIDIELLNDSVKSQLERGKFKIKDK